MVNWHPLGTIWHPLEGPGTKKNDILRGPLDVTGVNSVEKAPSSATQSDLTATIIIIKTLQFETHLLSIHVCVCVCFLIINTHIIIPCNKKNKSLFTSLTKEINRRILLQRWPLLKPGLFGVALDGGAHGQIGHDLFTSAIDLKSKSLKVERPRNVGPPCLHNVLCRCD